MPIVHLDCPEVVFTYATDLHLAALPPGRRRGSYRQEILGKVAFWAELTQALHGVGLCGGDVFHVKNPLSKSNSFGVINEIIHTFGSFPLGRVFGVVGNHDVTGDNVQTLPDQPMGVLMSAGVYQPVGVNDEDPWIFESSDGTRVRIDTYDWMPGEDLLAALQAARCERESWDGIGQLDYDEWPWHYRVAVVHSFQQSGASGLMFNKDFALGHADLTGTDYDVICYGHDHSRKGITDYDQGPTHVQLGSLARAALSEDETDRDVALAIMEFKKHTTPKVTERVVPVTPLHLAFHTADLGVTKAENREEVREFFKTLEQNAKEVQETDPAKILVTLTDDPAVIQTIKEACEMP